MKSIWTLLFVVIVCSGTQGFESSDESDDEPLASNIPEDFTEDVSDIESDSSDVESDEEAHIATSVPDEGVSDASDSDSELDSDNDEVSENEEDSESEAISEGDSDTKDVSMAHLKEEQTAVNDVLKLVKMEERYAHNEEAAKHAAATQTHDQSTKSKTAQATKQHTQASGADVSIQPGAKAAEAKAAKKEQEGVANVNSMDHTTYDYGKLNAKDFARMKTKAEGHFSRIEAHHRPYGQVWNTVWDVQGASSSGCVCSDQKKTDCTDGTNLQVKNTVNTYGAIGDGAHYTGIYTAGVSWRCVVEKTEEACAYAKTMVDELYRLLKVTGLKGVLARAYETPEVMCKAKRTGEKEYCYLPRSNDPNKSPSTTTYKDYWYAGDISRDQYSGWMFGLTAAWEAIDDASTKDKIKEMVDDFVGELLENDFELTQWNDKKLSFKPNLIDWGRAVMTLSYLRTAYHITGKQKFLDEYESRTTGIGYTWADRACDWLGTLDVSLLVKCHRENYYRFVIGVQPLFNLIRLETDQALKDRYLEVMDRFWSGNGVWNGVESDKNMYFDIMYSVARDSTGAKKKAVKQLYLAPEAPLFRSETHNVIDDKKGCENENYAENALPMDIRPNLDFSAQRDPRSINQACVQPWVEYAGITYFTSYWMGRYYNLYGSNGKTSGVTSI